MKPSMPTDHQTYMLTSLSEAEKARQLDEVPVGASIFSSSGKIISKAHNQVISLGDPTAHAEVLALRQACRKMGNYRLPGTTLYVTVEPCPMCMGAIIHARVKRIVFGTFDVKWGAAGSLYNLAADTRLNHRVEVITGILENPCRKLMQDFFRSKRNRSPDR